MLSLAFLCARKVVSDHASTRRALDFIPEELYPELFKAAFLDKKTLVVQDLVQRWPFSVLSFQKLLHGDRGPAQPRGQPSKQCVQTVILGVTAYLSHALTKEDGGGPARKGHLRLLDMTGILDDGLERDPDTMSVWSRTVTLAKACIDVSKRCSEDGIRLTKRRRGSDKDDSAGTPAAFNPSVHVDVRVDLFVNSTSYSVLREALLVSSQSPLRLQCRDLWAEELSLRSTAELLELLNPSGVRLIDLRFNNLGLVGLNILLPRMAKFVGLKSLKLPYSNVDVRRLSPAMEEGLQRFASHLGQLCALKELNLGSSRLSGRLRQLLSCLQKPLESLELAFCSLLPVDLCFLSQSFHVCSMKKLDLSGNNLSEILLQPFRQLLVEVSHCLIHLDVIECKLTDAHLAVIAPALCRCSRLRYLGLFCNPISSKGLKTLLQDLLPLPDLRQVVYPFPVDCCSDFVPWPSSSPALDVSFEQTKLAQVATELQQMLVSAQRTDVIWTTDMCKHRSLDYLSF
ncbi:leucine-rich repeat-containing protein 14 [Spea bombifrons]|uniref:leucine-rich repeat-containing protein 14 n=1 Tax=Spea bombifrons TaxID=233779 RepID=UPI002349F884|nr:leucine-rich repeat-containing protein 14 [Spea bombifrons]